MLKVRNQAGRTIPFLFCDACGKIIEDGAAAGVVYKKLYSKPGEDVTESEVLFAHKGVCMDSLEESLGDGYDGWEELSRYLAFITNNVKFKPKALAEALEVNKKTGL
jgi:hypothetical protein